MILDPWSVVVGIGGGALVASAVLIPVGVLLRHRALSIWQSRAQQADTALSQVAHLTSMRDRLQTDLDQARVTAAAAQATVDTLKRAHTDAVAQLTDFRSAVASAFGDLAAQALDRNARAVTDIVGQAIAAGRDALTADLSKNQAVTSAATDRTAQDLADLSHRLQVMEQARSAETAALATRIDHLAAIAAQVGQQTASVAQSLTVSAQQRGAWGEIILERILEHAGIAQHIMWSRQVHVAGAGPDGSEIRRPDVVITLPGDRCLPIDAKAPQITVGSTMDGSAYAGAIDRHVQVLASKRYQQAVGNAFDAVVCFLPNDGALAAACQADPELLMRSWERRVILASPSTMLALVHAVAHIWASHAAQASANEILAQATDLVERMAVFADHLRKTGGALTSAVEHYNGAIGSFSARVQPTCRRIQELGVAQGRAAEATDVIGQIDSRPRSIG